MKKLEQKKAATECEGCGDEQSILYMHSRCHTDAPTWTKIDLEANQAIVECCECREEIIRLNLAENKDD